MPSPPSDHLDARRRRLEADVGGRTQTPEKTRSLATLPRYIFPHDTATDRPPHRSLAMLPRGSDLQPSTPQARQRFAPSAWQAPGAASRHKKRLRRNLARSLPPFSRSVDRRRMRPARFFSAPEPREPTRLEPDALRAPMGSVSPHPPREGSHEVTPLGRPAEAARPTQAPPTPHWQVSQQADGTSARRRIGHTLATLGSTGPRYRTPCFAQPATSRTFLGGPGPNDKASRLKRRPGADRFGQ